jgi:hypothetical protein
MEQAFALRPDLDVQLPKMFAAATPFMRLLCDALGVAF